MIGRFLSLTRLAFIATALIVVKYADDCVRSALDLRDLKDYVFVHFLVDGEFSCLSESHLTAWVVTSERKGPRVHELVFFQILF